MGRWRERAVDVELEILRLYLFHPMVECDVTVWLSGPNVAVFCD